MKTILKTLGLQKKINQNFVLDIPEFSIYPYENIALIGPNGAGKSTFLRILNLLEKPDKGEIFWKEEKINLKKLKIRFKMALIFSESLLFQGKVFDNAALGLTFRKFSRKEIDFKVNEILEKLKIKHLKNNLINELSSGEAQRVNLARALVLQPEVLLLDEPFSSLDLIIKEELINDFKEVLGGYKLTTLFVTHNKEEALKLGDNLIIMHQGRFIQKGKMEEVLSSPNSTFAAKFIGMENFYRGKIVKEREETKFIVKNVSFKILPDKKGNNAILRPEEILLSRLSFSSSARNIFSGEIIQIVQTEALIRVTLDIGVPLIALLTKASFEEMNLKLGEKIFATFKVNAIHIL
ncbi:MAG: ABC transporter ATP-binding protein [Armatimonadetes bacterium]|nr:ABC transporter ATP-binding protein [Armatimonadota bacterium]